MDRAGEPLEISDLIVDYDPATLARRPVLREEAARLLETNGQRRAARYVRSLPAADGVLDQRACDAVLVRAHTELQRASVVVLGLGPFTLLRPPVIAAMALVGVRAAPDWRAATTVAVPCLLQLAIEPWLGRAWRRGGRPCG